MGRQLFAVLWTCIPLALRSVSAALIADRLDHLLKAHGYLAAPVQRGGEPPAELAVPAPFGPNWPGLAVAAELSMGVDARPEGPLASLGHVTKGELCREQALVSWCSRPSDTWGFKSPGTPGQLVMGMCRPLFRGASGLPSAWPWLPISRMEESQVSM